MGTVIQLAEYRRREAEVRKGNAPQSSFLREVVQLLVEVFEPFVFLLGAYTFFVGCFLWGMDWVSYTMWLMFGLTAICFSAGVLSRIKRYAKRRKTAPVVEDWIDWPPSAA